MYFEQAKKFWAFRGNNGCIVSVISQCSAVSGHYRTLIAESVGMDAILFSAADSKRELYHFRDVTKGSELGVWELFPYIYIYIYIFPHLPCICFCFFFWLCFLGLFYWSCFLFTALFKNTRTLKVQKPPFQLHYFFAAVKHNYEYKQQTLKHRNTQNGSKSTNDKPWIFELVKVNFCFLRGPLRWLTVMKNANVSWVLNFRIPVFLKSIVIKFSQPINHENTKTMVREHFSDW